MYIYIYILFEMLNVKIENYYFWICGGVINIWFYFIFLYYIFNLFIIYWYCLCYKILIN